MMLQAILDWDHLPYAVAGLAVLVTAPVLLRIKNSIDRKRRRDAYPKDTVILHQIGPGPFAPSFSPFPVKLETYLRFAKVPYENEHSMEMSAMGKTPWMTYNGEDVADSQICIDYLNEKLGIDLNSHLSQQEKALARAWLKLLEDSLYWSGAMYRWRMDDNIFNYVRFQTIIPRALVLRAIRSTIQAQGKAQGTGRHTDQQIMHMFYGDLQALSVFLGKKPFLMGEQPSEVDCSMFGILSQPRWNMPDSTPERWMQGDFSNLGEYCDRMKEKFWPDWDDCITHGK